MDDLQYTENENQQPVREKYTPCAVCCLIPGIVPPHFHDAIEIIFTTSGSSTAICNGVKYPLSTGSVFIAASNEVHYFTERTDDTTGLVIDIEPQILFGSASHFKDSIPLYHVWNDPKMENSLWELVNLIHKHIHNFECDLAQDTLTALTSAILIFLLDCVELEKATLPNATITQILNYCQEHFTEPISLEVLSNELHLSVSHISRIFSHKLKISFSDYLNGLRLNKAINLLNEPQITITKAAAYAGFPTSQTFNRIFMAQYGMTPTQFRNMHKKTITKKVNGDEEK